MYLVNEKNISFRGRLKFRHKDYYGAIIDFTTALSLNNKNIENLILRAKSYFFNDNDDDDELGCLDLQSAIKLGSKEAEELEKDLCEGDEIVETRN